MTYGKSYCFLICIFFPLLCYLIIPNIINYLLCLKHFLFSTQIHMCICTTMTIIMVTMKYIGWETKRTKRLMMNVIKEILSLSIIFHLHLSYKFILFLIGDFKKSHKRNFDISSIKRLFTQKGTREDKGIT